MSTAGTSHTSIVARMATGGTVLLFMVLGIANLAHVPSVLEGVTHLGYPAYLATILGVWQLLGAAAIAGPVSPRLKEWAYAGMFFNLSGATASHIASGDPFARVLVPLVLLGVVMTSWRGQSEGGETREAGRGTVVHELPITNP